MKIATAKAPTGSVAAIHVPNRNFGLTNEDGETSVYLKGSRYVVRAGQDALMAKLQTKAESGDTTLTLVR